MNHLVEIINVKADLSNYVLGEMENKISTTSTLIAVENKIPDVSSLLKKTIYNTEITEIVRELNDLGNFYS